MTNGGRSARLGAAWTSHLHQADGNDDGKVDAGGALHGAAPDVTAGLVAAVRLGARAGPIVGEGEGSIPDRVVAAAVEHVLDAADGGGIVGPEAAHPVVFEHAVERRRRHDALEEQGGEHGGQQTLQGLQDEGGELPDAAARREVGVPEHRRVRVGIEEGEDGEQSGEDGDGGRDGQRERRAVEVGGAV